MSAPRPMRIDESLAEVIEDLKRSHKEKTGVNLSTSKASRFLAHQIKEKKSSSDFLKESKDDWRLF